MSLGRRFHDARATIQLVRLTRYAIPALLSICSCAPAPRATKAPPASTATANRAPAPATQAPPRTPLQQHLARCESGDGDACLMASFMVGDAATSDAHLRQAAVLKRRACELRVAAGCTNYGADLANGLGVARNHELAATYFGKACELGSVLGCAHYGGRLEGGWGIAQDKEKAKAIYEDACAKNGALACNRLAELLLKSGRVGERATAVVALERACELRSALSCWRAGELGSPMKVQVELVRQTLAAEKAGCDDGYGANCHGAAQFYGLGVGMPRDLAKAMALYQRGCDREYQASCETLAKLKDRARRRSQLKLDIVRCNSATKKNRAVCHKSATVLLNDREPGDVAAAIPLLRRGCNLNGAASCETLGFVHYEGRGVAINQGRAMKFIVKACRLGQSGACNNAGLILARDKKDFKKAVGYFARGCTLGAGRSCRNAAAALLRTGKRVDRRKAISFLGRGCKLGNRSACALGRSVEAGKPARKAATPEKTSRTEPPKKDRKAARAKLACYQDCFAKKDQDLTVRQLRKQCLAACGLPAYSGGKRH